MTPYQLEYLADIYENITLSKISIVLKADGLNIPELFKIFPQGNMGYNIHTGEPLFFTNLKKEGLNNSTDTNC